jgi:hypothetical protein
MPREEVGHGTVAHKQDAIEVEVLQAES